MANEEAPRGQVYFVPGVRVRKDVDGNETKTNLKVPLGAAFPNQYFPVEGDYTRDDTYIQRRVMMDEGKVYKNRSEAMKDNPEVFNIASDDASQAKEAPVPIEDRPSLAETARTASERFRNAARKEKASAPIEAKADLEKKPPISAETEKASGDNFKI